VVIVTDESGLACFDLLRARRIHAAAVLCAFDLLELDGEDLRALPIEKRKARLARLLKNPHAGIALNQHYDADGAIIFREACKLGCEGIVSKRLGSPYRSGRSDHWLKIKNPRAPAMRDWENGANNEQRTNN
jgi:bifunctional non-homologous end joining protein LigD